MQSSWSWPCQLLRSRSAIGKAAPPPQTEPGTARGLAKQVQVRPSIFAMLWWRQSPPPDLYLVFSPGFICLQPLLPSPAPRTHPVSPFLGVDRVRSSVFVLFCLQNLRAGFCDVVGGPSPVLGVAKGRERCSRPRKNRFVIRPNSRYSFPALLWIHLHRSAGLPGRLRMSPLRK